MTTAASRETLRLHGSVELPRDLHERVRALAAEGEELLEHHDLDGAVRVWQEALGLLPDPQGTWRAYTHLWALIGDAYYELRRDDEAATAFMRASYGRAGRENPLLHFKLGKALLHSGHSARAVEELRTAYKLDGADIFEDDAEGEAMLQILREAGVSVR